MTDQGAAGLDLKQACVVVTGAGNGIGAAVAGALAARGAHVVVADLDAGGVEATTAAITAAGGSALPSVGDVATDAGIAALIDTATEHFGPIHAWFANAGVDRGRGLAASDREWEASLEVNVLAHVRAARMLVPQWLKAGGGRFVVTASAAGLLTMLDAPAYSVSKHAAVAFAEWLSATYRHRGIVVQAICPQGVQTRMLAESGPLAELLSHDTALTAQQVAEQVVDALTGDDFLILPHPEVADYYRARATDTDRWLAGMNRLQQRLDES